MALAALGLSDPRAVAAHLAPLPLELAPGEGGDGLGAAGAEAPRTELDPQSQAQHQRAGALRAQRRLDPVIGLGAALEQPGVDHLVVAEAGQQHVGVAGVAELARQPGDLLAQRLIFLAADRGAEQRQCRAQAAQRDPRLVHGVSVARREQHDLVEPVVAQAAIRDDAERLAFRHRAVERDRLGPGAASEPVLGQRIAALALAQHAQPQRHRRAELASQLEQPCRLARLDLELELADGRLRLAAAHLAFVEDDLDAAALALDGPGAAADAGADQGHERVGSDGVEQRLQRRASQRLHVGREAGDLGLPFLADEQAGRFAAPALDGLDEAVARAAHPQREAGAA